MGYRWAIDGRIQGDAGKGLLGGFPGLSLAVFQLGQERHRNRDGQSAASHACVWGGAEGTSSQPAVSASTRYSDGP